MEMVALDREANRYWEVDLSLIPGVRPLKKRRYKGRRQEIVRFLGRDGTVERFTYRQTLPYPGHEEFSPPSQAQYGATQDFYQEACETRSQAHTMLCARDYAQEVARGSYDATRRRFLSLCTAAFILSDKDLRSVVVSWNASNRTHYYGVPHGSFYCRHGSAQRSFGRINVRLG